MSDLISRQAAIDAVSESLIGLFVEHEDIAKKMINKVPSAQPEIIRCKDCRYATMTHNGQCKYCDIWFPEEAEYMSGDHFCASAERRQDG